MATPEEIRAAILAGERKTFVLRVTPEIAGRVVGRKDFNGNVVDGELAAKYAIDTAEAIWAELERCGYLTW